MEKNKIKINTYEIRKILMFILSMQKTGASITSSLSYYGEKIAKAPSLKKAISNAVSQLSSGSKLEDVLKINGFLNNFQYAILKISKDKQSAIEVIINLGAKKNDALIYYFKQFSIFMLVFGGILFFVPYITDFFVEIMYQISKEKTEAIKGFMGWMLKNDDILKPIGILFFILYGVGLFFFKYSYEKSIALHYKLFKYSAMVDNHTLFSLINDLIKIETVSNSLGLISKHYEPKATRDHILNLKNHIDRKNLEKAEQELINLGVNDFARFSILSSIKIGETQKGFKNALINIEDYNKLEIENYKTNIDFLVFMITTMLISSAFLYTMLLEVKMGMM